jgi:hypothetical protein
MSPSTEDERERRRKRHEARFAEDPVYRKMRRDSARKAARKRRERAKTDAELAARLREDQRRYRDKLRADPELHAWLAGNYRIGYRLRTGTTSRQSPATFGGYIPPARHRDMLPAEPLVEFFKRWFPVEWTEYEIAGRSRGTLHSRTVRNLLVGLQTEVELSHVDRFFTFGLGRPDLLNAVYPMDGETA